MLTKALWTVILLAAATTLAAAQDLVIIASDGVGPAYAPGKSFAGGATIDLPKSARVTLLTKTGQVIKLKGPYSGALEARAGAGGKTRSLSQVAKIVGGSKRTKVLGATRAVRRRAGVKPADVWLGDLRRLRNFCARADQAQLWRANAKSTTALVITATGQASSGLVWPADAHVLDLPAAARRDKTAIKVLSAGKVTNVVVHVLPGDIERSDSGAVLHWMASVGCQSQAAELIMQIHTR